MQKDPPFVVWLTGLSGSGKTTLAKKLYTFLQRKRIPSVIVDGDEVRKTISQDLGFSKRDIGKNHRRVRSLVTSHLTKGKNVIVSIISPSARVRATARKKFPRFVEIFCDCPVSVCMRRDPKGHYRNVKNGTMKNFIGIHSIYEKPKNPELILHTNRENPMQSLKKIKEILKKRCYI
ncbi:MAG: adenylyl-sulfate kinase [Patescibacteria group bacterium]|nr:adenylyl-sulfate kinase [Patescibacteria group bacterium]